MDHTEEVDVDEDAVLRARTPLLGSGRPAIGQQVEAYRVLSSVSPLSYLPKLTEALLSYGYAPEVRDLPEVRLARHADAVATARRIDAGDPRRTELLARALSADRHGLYAAGRRSEGFAVCEETAAVGRWGFEQGQVSSPRYGHGPLATALAEGGSHREAEDARSEGPDKVSFWTMLEWAAELDAAGRRDAALEAFADIVDVSRGELAEDRTSLAIVTWQLVHQAGMPDAAGHHVEARGARQEALALMTELDRTGERKVWSNILSWWTMSGRSTEPAPHRRPPRPPRRLADVAGVEEGRKALGRALTDRSMFLVAAKQYGEAHDDYREVVGLLG